MSVKTETTTQPQTITPGPPVVYARNLKRAQRMEEHLVSKGDGGEEGRRETHETVEEKRGDAGDDGDDAEGDAEVLRDVHSFNPPCILSKV